MLNKQLLNVKDLYVDVDTAHSDREPDQRSVSGRADCRLPGCVLHDGFVYVPVPESFERT